MSLRVLNTTGGKWFCVLFVLFGTVFLLSRFSKTQQIIHNLHKNFRAKIHYSLPDYYHPPLNTSTFAKKWVVITSIFAPTDSVKVISRMTDWKLVVVGDKKTPTNWSWPNVVYLDVDMQETLGFTLSQHLGWNSFPRKALGYLYAMQHGAEYIYETDDDNVPMGQLDIFNHPIPHRLILKTTENAYNPHLHFGQSSTWPRGYPLDKIGLPISSTYTLCPTQQPHVIQGLVNGDPDIDAIFRLTRRFPLERIDIKFDPKAPLVIYPPGTYTPYNCQNTLFRKPAFWSMVLPASVSFRATDIFRAYWTEKLMEMVGQSLAFSSATFYQFRSPHNLLGDMKLEIPVYLDNFVKLIDGWECGSIVFSECMLELTRAVVEAGYYKESDYELIEAWIQDLRMIDPYLIDFPTSKARDICVGRRMDVIFFPHEQLTTMPHDPRLTIPAYVSNREAILNNYISLCHNNYSNYIISLDAQPKTFSQFVLVVKLKQDVENKIIFFLTYYKLHFNHILFCSETRPNNDFLQKWKASMVFFKKGTLNSMACISAATKIDYNVTGLFFMSEHMMLNVQTDIISTAKNSLVWLEKSLHLTDEECKTNDCFNITPTHLDAASKYLKDDNILKLSFDFDNQDRKFDPNFKETMKRLRAGMSKLRVDLKKQNDNILRISSDIIAYLPKQQAVTVYRVEKVLESVLKYPGLLHAIYYSLAYSGNDLNSLSDKPDFSSKFLCNSMKPECVCSYLN